LAISFSYSKRHSEFGSQPRALELAPAPPPGNPSRRFMSGVARASCA